jgi:hypothetical protein
MLPCCVKVTELLRLLYLGDTLKGCAYKYEAALTAELLNSRM